jgi:D-amino-acid dehydrogenase
LATAWQLQRDGHQVAVIDRAAPGECVTAGHGAQPSSSYVAPLADASIWRLLPHLLLLPKEVIPIEPAMAGYHRQRPIASRCAGHWKVLSQ